MTAGTALRKIKYHPIARRPGLASVTMRHVITIGRGPLHEPSMPGMRGRR